jgi:RimJ/RimL family protein N-acetyltransferase
MAMIEIVTERFILRPLVESDANDVYVSWFNDENTKSYIDFARKGRSLRDVRDYIAQKSSMEEVLFLGVFTKAEFKHIGNIKFEPVDVIERAAVMGILIGDVEWRGKGVAPEVLTGCVDWLAKNKNINKITLGVKSENLAAVAAYRKVGFVVKNPNESQSGIVENLTMILRL